MDKQQELIRQTSYIIAVNQASDAFAIENSIDEAEAYVEKFPLRKAVIVSDIYRNKRFDKIAYNQVQTFKKGTIRIVDKKNNENKNEVLQSVCTNLKNGLVIIHNQPVTGDILKEILYKENKGQDVIIHRNQIVLHPIEVQYINEQINLINTNGHEKAHIPLKAIYLRLHCIDAFQFNKGKLMELIESFGQEMGYLLFLCQFILFRKRDEYRKLLDHECKENGEQFETFIDPYYFKKESSNFVYLNILKQEIVGADIDFLQQCQAEIVEILQTEQV
jgi:hypothetical protein